MKIPFTLEKIYRSNFSSDNISQFIQQLDEQKSDFLGFDFKDYEVTNSKSNFEFQKRKKKTDTTFYPTVTGNILPDRQVNIQIKPNMMGIMILSFVGFLALVSTYSAVESLIKTGSFILFIIATIFSGIAYLYYKKTTSPITMTKEWLEESLELTEL